MLRIPEKIHERLELHEVHAAHREDRLIKASESVAESAQGLLWAVKGFKPMVEPIGMKLHTMELRQCDLWGRFDDSADSDYLYGFVFRFVFDSCASLTF